MKYSRDTNNICSTLQEFHTSRWPALMSFRYLASNKFITAFHDIKVQIWNSILVRDVKQAPEKSCFLLRRRQRTSKDVSRTWEMLSSYKKIVKAAGDFWQVANDWLGKSGEDPERAEVWQGSHALNTRKKTQKFFILKTIVKFNDIECSFRKNRHPTSKREINFEKTPKTSPITRRKNRKTKSEPEQINSLISERW